MNCMHPVRASYPGAPSHAKCRRRQIKTVVVDSSTNLVNITLDETMDLDGIPYSDYFLVKTVWRISDIPQKNADEKAPTCLLTVSALVKFMKNTWLKGTIASSSESELKEAINLWKVSALANIEAGVPIAKQLKKKKAAAEANDGELSPARILRRASSFLMGEIMYESDTLDVR